MKVSRVGRPLLTVIVSEVDACTPVESVTCTVSVCTPLVRDVVSRVPVKPTLSFPCEQSELCANAPQTSGRDMGATGIWNRPDPASIDTETELVGTLPVVLTDHPQT